MHSEEGLDGGLHTEGVRIDERRLKSAFRGGVGGMR